MHLLFWLSMVPFSTAWMGENHFAAAPVALYGFVLLMNGVAYIILAKILINHHGDNSLLAKALGGGFKGPLSVFCYALAIGLSFFQVWLSAGLYVLVALMWLVPDRKIEKILHEQRE